MEMIVIDEELAREVLHDVFIALRFDDGRNSVIISFLLPFPRETLL